VGIPPDQLEKVFEGFYRARNLADWQSGSIGLGLYISRHIARQHGGDLWAETRAEGGARLTLKIPLFETQE
jgi:two-component system sensor histidine kinase VicK